MSFLTGKKNFIGKKYCQTQYQIIRIIRYSTIGIPFSKLEPS